MKEVSELLREHPVGEYKLDPEKLTERQKLLNRCKERCLYLITESEKTESRLREKLRKSGKYADDIIDEAMDFLKCYEYLDDRRYARRLIKQYEGQKSLKEIRQKLYQRGVNQKDIREVLSSYREEEDSEEQELTAIRRVIAKKYRDAEEIENLERNEKQKLYVSLVRKGFSYSLVQKALRVMEEN